MSDKIRRKLIAGFVFFVLAIMVFSPTEIVEPASDLKDYYMTYFIRDTRSLNAVTGIYLNYRVFDTLFETLVLLVSVIEGDY